MIIFMYIYLSLSIPYLSLSIHFSNNLIFPTIALVFSILLVLSFYSQDVFLFFQIRNRSKSKFFFFFTFLSLPPHLPFFLVRKTKNKKTVFGIFPSLPYLLSFVTCFSTLQLFEILTNSFLFRFTFFSPRSLPMNKYRIHYHFLITFLVCLSPLAPFTSLKLILLLLESLLFFLSLLFFKGEGRGHSTIFPQTNFKKKQKRQPKLILLNGRRWNDVLIKYKVQ